MQRWVLGLAFIVGCGAGGGDDADDAPSFTGTPPGQGGSTGSNPMNAGGASNAPGSMAPVGNASGGSAPVSNGGAPVAVAGSGGNVGEGNGGVGSLDPGGVAGSASNNGGASGSSSQPPPGGSGPGVTPPDPGGPFVSVPVSGGASAAFVCPDGPFGNPLQGMGAVQSVSAPQGSNFAFIEGPVWIASRNRLFFSDNVFGQIWQIEPPFTAPSLFMEDTGANGMAVDNEDQLLVADQNARRITRVNPATAQITETVVPSANFRPNDLVLRSDENIYFSDPDSGAGRGFYRVSPSGQLDGPFSQSNTPNTPGAPNGILLTPDENHLYVGDVQQRFVSILDLEADGTIDTASARVFVRTTGDTVDGMALDCAGNLYVGTRTGVEVYAPDATPIGTVPTGESSNVTFGGADRRTMFVTSRAQLKLVTLGVPGLPD
ncbi:MAG TPA: SMP-30/gluconolactonase/LRE family protein [Polyangiaceae bacterium]|nr:SMP-30/gluconolactonase/LRE family protein [Polyangiaceae bacterium]